MSKPHSHTQMAALLQHVEHLVTVATQLSNQVRVFEGMINEQGVRIDTLERKVEALEKAPVIRRAPHHEFPAINGNGGYNTRFDVV